MKALWGFMAAFGAAGFIGILTLWALIIWGWVLNIIGLVGSIGGAIDALFILRIVGIFFAPLGAVLGWWW